MEKVKELFDRAIKWINRAGDLWTAAKIIVGAIGFLAIARAWYLAQIANLPAWAVFLVVFSVVVLVILGWAAYAVIRIVSQVRPALPAILSQLQQAPPVPVTQPTPTAAAGQDQPPLDQFGQQILVYRGEVALDALAKNDPFILFTFWFFNGSLTEKFNFKRTEGHVRFNDDEQSQDVEFHGGAAAMRSYFGHGVGCFVIRQWVRSETAKYMPSVIHGAEPRGRAEFRFDNVRVMIGRMNDPKNAEFQLSLPTLTRKGGRDEIVWIIDWR